MSFSYRDSKAGRPRLARVGLSLVVACVVGTSLSPMESAAQYGGSSGGGGGVSVSGGGKDPLFDKGKAVYRGRAESAKGTKFCVVDKGGEGEAPEAKKLSRSNLKPFKGGSKRVLMLQLVDCEDATKPARTVLSAEDLRALVHYLDGRFKLKLGG